MNRRHRTRGEKRPPAMCSARGARSRRASVRIDPRSILAARACLVERTEYDLLVAVRTARDVRHRRHREVPVREALRVGGEAVAEHVRGERGRGSDERKDGEDAREVLFRAAVPSSRSGGAVTRRCASW